MKVGTFFVACPVDRPRMTHSLGRCRPETGNRYEKSDIVPQMWTLFLQSRFMLDTRHTPQSHARRRPGCLLSIRAHGCLSSIRAHGFHLRCRAHVLLRSLSRAVGSGLRAQGWECHHRRVCFSDDRVGVSRGWQCKKRRKR